MPWSTSDRRSRLPANWPALVAMVKRRDQGRCCWILKSGKRCPRPGTDVDHIEPGDDHRMDNLQLLCEEHHARKSAAEGHAGKRRLARIPPRSQGRHPGAVG